MCLGYNYIWLNATNIVTLLNATNSSFQLKLNFT